MTPPSVRLRLLAALPLVVSLRLPPRPLVLVLRQLSPVPLLRLPLRKKVVKTTRKKKTMRIRCSATLRFPVVLSVNSNW